MSPMFSITVERALKIYKATAAFMSREPDKRRVTPLGAWWIGQWHDATEEVAKAYDARVKTLHADCTQKRVRTPLELAPIYLNTPDLSEAAKAELRKQELPMFLPGKSEEFEAAVKAYNEEEATLRGRLKPLKRSWVIDMDPNLASAFGSLMTNDLEQRDEDEDEDAGAKPVED